MNFEEVDGCVHSVETCGTVDGPGLRYVLFLSGCPLRCQYCHNPDTQGKSSGQRRTAGEVASDMVRYRNFIRCGGVTISGGEPLVQPRFTHAILHLARQAGLHTALDTSGFLGARATDDLLACTDLVLLDIKSFVSTTYRDVTGVSLKPTLEFAKRLDRMRKPVWIRFVLVPGLTDEEANLTGLAGFVATLGNVERVEVLPFHQMGEMKYQQAGIEYRLAGVPTPTADQVQHARDVFRSYGTDVA